MDNPSKEQLAVKEALLTTLYNLFISATAGSGKTSTLVWLLGFLRDKTVLCCAFNKDIKEELSERCKIYQNVKVSTLHALGYGLLKKEYGSGDPNPSKYRKIFVNMSPKWTLPDDKDFGGRVLQLVDLLRLCYVKNMQEAFDVAKLYSIPNVDHEVEIALEVVEAGRAIVTDIDFTDMIYLPVFYNLTPRTRYQVLCVDECITGDTMLTTINGSVPIKDIKIGDKVLASFEKTGKVVYDTIVNKWNKGFRKTLIIKTANRTIRCTHNHKIYTNLGWLYAGTIKKLLNDNTISLYINDGQEYIPYEEINKTIDIRHNARRWQHEFRGQEIQQISKIQSVTINNTTRICGNEIRSFAGTSIDTTSNSRKQGIRKTACEIYNKIITSVNKILQFVYGEQIEKSKPKLVRPAYCGGAGLLVHGRWRTNWFKSKDSHVLVQYGRTSFVAKPFVDDLRIEINCETGEKQVSIIRNGCSKQEQISKVDITICNPINDEKDLHIGNTQNLQNLRQSFCYTQEDNIMLLQELYKEKQQQIGRKISQEEIIGIEDGIIEEVYDIETEKTHTFYANGILVHNCQDLNKLQRLFIFKYLATGGRTISFGDKFQCIYSFMGADVKSFSTMQNMPNTKVFPLSVTYRCPKAVVRYLGKYNNEIRAWENSPEGVVNQSATIEDIKSGDAVLCRNNMPLAKLCMQFLSQGVKAYIRGRDIGENLVKLIQKPKKSSVIDAIKWLAEDLQKIKAKMVRAHRLPESDIEEMSEFVAMQDKIDTLKAITYGCLSVDDAINKIKRIFADDKREGIMLSTVHKAKGLEFKNVFIICDWVMPSKFAKTDLEKEQENNIQFVAYSRTKYSLNFIDKEIFDPYKKEKKFEFDESNPYGQKTSYP